MTSSTTAADGAFTLAAPAGASVRLRALLPAGATFSPALIGDPGSDSDIAPAGANTGFSAPFTAAAADSTRDVGVQFPATTQIGNFVFHDQDGEGDQDPGEPGLSGVTVELWNESRTQLLQRTVTSAVGAYALQAPQGATYIVHFGDVARFARTWVRADSNLTDSDAAADGSSAGDTAPIRVALGTASISTIDAGYFRPLSIGDRVWDDVDADGVQDAGEPGLANVTVQLWNTGRTFLFDQTTSNASGVYALIGSREGSYRVRAVLSSGAQFSPKNIGGASTDSDIYASGGTLGFTDPIGPFPSLDFVSSYDIGVDLP